ncbi:MAG TPA: ClcB-like voltage-gated chloride channel protein [Steroidobacteraceae bacterium]|jgi:CIC family chloride channel protein|nr:ClcB-like voltage-gated chloride channel protein [Steroidobacteraceae bacterium]
MHLQAREFARVPLSLLTRLRLILFGHEDLAGIVFWAALVGFFGALASVVFRESIRLFTRFFTGFTYIGEGSGLVYAASSLVWWHRALVPIVGGVLAGAVLHFVGRTFVSSKAVDYMEAVMVGDGKIGFRASILRSFGSLLTISSGGSIGREGSMVQLSAMLGSRLGLFARAPIPRLRLMVGCGAAAGIAAAYNAPISGALFVSEIVLGSTAMESFGPLVVSSVVSSATIRRLLGYGSVFDVPHVIFVGNVELIFYVMLGVLLGHLAPPFLSLLDFAKSQFVRLKLPLYWQLGLGGVILGAISIFVPEVWGNGYSVVSRILQGQLLGVWLLIVLLSKVVATSVTVGSGGVGGVLTPSLFIGAAVGALVGGVLHGLMPHFASVPAAYALIGMGGFLAATTQAPLTSILMIFEMTLDYNIVLPLMLACVTAHYTAKVYRKGQSVYHASLNRAIVAEHGDDWRLRTVETLVKPPAAVVTATTSLADIFDQLPKRPLQRVYVTSGDDLIAWFDPRKVLDRLQKGEIDWGLPAESVSLPVNFALSPDMSLCEALDGFLREQATALPVTPGQWRHTLLGEVSRSDVLLAIQDRLTYPK